MSGVERSSSAFRIEGAADAVRLADAVAAGSARWTSVVVAVPELGPLGNRQVAERIGALYGACGCRSGAAVGLLALAVVAAWRVLRAGPWQALDLALPALAFVIGVVAGKLGGLAWARRTVVGELRQLAARLDPQRIG